MSIVEAFDYYFELIPANTIELQQEVYKLRYQVYCLEKSFENPETHSNGLEYDEYDDVSTHYLIRHREFGYMATTRLILPNKNDPEKLFPIEVYSQIDNLAILKDIPRSQLAELSRFCVSKNFRRRAHEKDLIISNDAPTPERVTRYDKGSSPNLTLALFTCGIRMSKAHNIQYWYAIMEPALKRVVAALGVDFIQIGPVVDYHGLRVPCVIKIDTLLKSVAEKNEEYFDMLMY